MKFSQFNHVRRPRSLFLSSALTVLLLLLCACGTTGGNSSTTGSSTTSRTATAVKQTTSTSGITPTVGISPSPTQSDSVNCPHAPQKPEVVADFERSDDGWGIEQPSPATAEPSQEKFCQGEWSLKVTTSPLMTGSNPLRTVVVLSPQMAIRDLRGWEFGCYSFFKSDIVATRGLPYYLELSAISPGSAGQYYNDQGGNFSGIEVLSPKNVNRWVYSYVDIGAHSENEDPGFDASQVFSFSVALKSSPASPTFSGSFFIDYCVLIHHQRTTQSDPSNM